METFSILFYQGAFNFVILLQYNKRYIRTIFPLGKTGLFLIKHLPFGIVYFTVHYEHTAV